MNITIEARALSAASGGVKTYTQELLKNLLLLHTEEKLEFIYGSQKLMGSFPGVREAVIPLYSDVLLPLWMNTVSNHVAKQKPNVVHYTKAAIPKKKSAPTVVTIYDVIPILFPETQSILRRYYWARALAYAAKKSDHILTISQRSKLDIIEHFGVSEEKITVTPLAVDLTHFKPTLASSTPGVGALTPGVFPASKPYILFVGTKDARKNISSLIRAFAHISHQIPHQLIIAGRPAKKEDNSKQIVQELRLQNRVEFREDVSYAQLPALYSGADVFVWPSIYEGWGFPPQEAMACGTPVIVSDGGPLPEVVGDAGIVVPLGLGPHFARELRGAQRDDGFVEKLAHEMLSLIQDDARKQDLIQRGLAHVKMFSWKTVAEKTWDVYKKVAL
ncbi:MAG: glycosyltransferase family 1 protein [bacterium]|nr:glycosyltransferase family 1 protein [bacterium]